MGEVIQFPVKAEKPLKTYTITEEMVNDRLFDLLNHQNDIWIEPGRFETNHTIGPLFDTDVFLLEEGLVDWVTEDGLECAYVALVCKGQIEAQKIHERGTR